MGKVCGIKLDIKPIKKIYQKEIVMGIFNIGPHLYSSFPTTDTPHLNPSNKNDITKSSNRKTNEILKILGL